MAKNYTLNKTASLSCKNINRVDMSAFFRLLIEPIITCFIVLESRFRITNLCSTSSTGLITKKKRSKIIFAIWRVSAHLSSRCWAVQMSILRSISIASPTASTRPCRGPFEPKTFNPSRWAWTTCEITMTHTFKTIWNSLTPPWTLS